MFTGLEQAVGVVSGAEDRGGIRRLTIDPGAWAHRPGPGDSVCVSGCCLTVAGIEGERLAFDAIPETLSRTTLGGLEAGDRVNLEHSVTPTTLLDGHIVQGHVDGLGRVAHVQTGDDWRVRVEPGDGLARYVVPKGSVCVAGVSLTVAGSSEAGASPAWFEVALIPETLERTTLRDLRAGEMVNLECDAMVKAMAHLLERAGVLASASSDSGAPAPGATHGIGG